MSASVGITHKREGPSEVPSGVLGASGHRERRGEGRRGWGWGGGEGGVGWGGKGETLILTPVVQTPEGKGEKGAAAGGARCRTGIRESG